MKLTDRGKAMLVLGKRICWSKSAFNDVATWNDCKSELKLHCANYYVQTKSYERNNVHKNDNNEQSPESRMPTLDSVSKNYSR